MISTRLTTPCINVSYTEDYTISNVWLDTLDYEHETMSNDGQHLLRTLQRFDNFRDANQVFDKLKWDFTMSVDDISNQIMHIVNKIGEQHAS